MIPDFKNSQIISYLQNEPINRIYLFGSYARNEQTNNSDIDLLIEPDYTHPIDLFLFIEWKQKLEKLLNKSVDLVAADAVSKYIKPRIEKEKILLYEKE